MAVNIVFEDRNKSPRSDLLKASLLIAETETETSIFCILCFSGPTHCRDRDSSISWTHWLSGPTPHCRDRDFYILHPLTLRPLLLLHHTADPFLLSANIMSSLLSMPFRAEPVNFFLHVPCASPTPTYTHSIQNKFGTALTKFLLIA